MTSQQAAELRAWAFEGSAPPDDHLTPTVQGDKLHIPTFACMSYHRPSQQAGRGYRMILCARVMVCAKCKAIIDARRAR